MAVRAAGTAHARDGKRRLEDMVPLRRRQADLPAAWARLHRRILIAWAATGTAREPRELAGDLSPPALAAALRAMADADLVLLDPAGAILGAYPFTAESTPHRVWVGDRWPGAMCAVDALGVSPLLRRATEIRSECRLNARAVHLHQRPEGILGGISPAGLQVGIHWRRPQGCTAHSLCREMVFLAGPEPAGEWREAAPGQRLIYRLGEALWLGERFFRPLLAGPRA